AGQLRVQCRMQADEKAVQIGKSNDEHHQRRLARLAREHETTRKQVQEAGETRRKEYLATTEQAGQKASAEYEANWSTLQSEWQGKIGPLYAAFREAKADADRLFPPGPAPVSDEWPLPQRFEQAARFARIRVDVDKLAEAKLAERKLILPGSGQFDLPLLLTYPREGSILFETAQTGQADAIGALNNVILRLLSVSPPGRLNFTIIDPVGLGQNFAGVMHLADYEEQLINSRIWTQSGQI